ncbi:MAG: glutamine--fructose-6-phosphate transaminase (isomerizing) [Flavobacteriales bacterium]
MCGIVGYIGDKQAFPILIKGLKRLEYRGYDSAGVALINENGLNLYKRKGKVSELENLTKDKDMSGTLGIGHTRWATHGVPDDKNAHPHYSDSESLVIIHNGIIENYATLKEGLEKRGMHFRSDTDTEVLGNLIEYILEHQKVDLAEAVRLALNEVVGAYAIAVLKKDDPDRIIAAKKGSPLVIGVGNGEFFLASDGAPIVEYTKDVIYLEDEQIAILERGKAVRLKTIRNNEVTPFLQQLEMDLEEIEKGGYPHFMIKEIHEQPRSITDSLRGRLDTETGRISMAGLIEYEHKLLNADRIIIVACGTSWHAALVGEYMIEELARIPVEVEYASEFRYRNPIITERDIVIAISQSGETADTLAAIQLAKEKGATIFGICNVVGSSIARTSHAGAYTHAGPEIGVASTKAFTAQVSVLALISLFLGRKKGVLQESEYFRLINELNEIPNQVAEALQTDSLVKMIAEEYKDAPNCLYLGRGFNFPVALEGALKLKEISYIHAEGYPAAEMKHGPIALIDENMPVVIVATKRGHYEKILSNIQEVKARKGHIIAVVNKGDTEVRKMADHVIEVPETCEEFSPMVTTVPLQFLAYHIAVMRGCNVDQPRNLAKSVTVE